MILMIDNYDSFTYNLVQYLLKLEEEVAVRRNDQITIEEIEQIAPDIIILSPGPCTPKEAGITLETIEKFKGKIPILGICLGHQSIALAFGGKIIKAKEPVHGKVYSITHSSKGIFKGLKTPLKVTRYHSLIVDRESLPSCFEITAETDKGEIMGIKHREFLVEGVQYHPEALLTEQGLELLENFLKEAKEYRGKKCS